MPILVLTRLVLTTTPHLLSKQENTAQEAGMHWRNHEDM
jgi:hypothetical protein